MRFDVSDLRIFRAVIDAGSMTAAAARVHLTVPSISERIKQMEEDVGAPLLLRNRAGAKPTDAGRVLLQHAAKIIRQVEFMNLDLLNYGHRARSNVRMFATTHSVMEYLMSPVQDFLHACPNADLNIEEHLIEDIVGAVANGTADIGLASDFVESADLETIAFRRDRLVAVVGMDFEVTSAEPIWFETLLSHNFIGHVRGSRLQEIFETHAREAGQLLRHRVQMRNLDSVCQLVAAGAGISLLPRRIAMRFAPLGLRTIELADEWAPYNLKICVRKRDDLTPSAAALLNCLLDDSVRSED